MQHIVYQVVQNVEGAIAFVQRSRDNYAHLMLVISLVHVDTF